jgi:hypothetical protein
VTRLAIAVVLFGQFPLPWLCVCGVATTNAATDSGRVECERSCCKSPPIPRKSPDRECPCPAQFAKFWGKSPAKIERADPATPDVDGPAIAVAIDRTPPATVGVAIEAMISPRSETRYWRIRVQHCLRC